MRTYVDTLAERYGMEEAVKLDMHRRAMWDATGYKPTPAQAEWLFHPSNTIVVSGGVRSGKSFSSTKKADWILGKDGALIWIIGPDYEQAMMEFDYIYEAYDSVGLIEWVSRPQEGQCRLKVKGGALVETKSSDNLTKLANKAPDFILVVEAGQQDEGVAGKVYERALEKDATICFTGTFEEASLWYEDTFNEFQIEGNPIGGASFSMATWTNTHSFPGGKDDPKFLRLIHGLTHDAYMERVAAIPYRMSGRVVRGLDKKRHIVPLELDKSLPVYIATDPATHCYPILFIQKIGRRIHVLDEIYERDIITQDIIKILMDHPLFPYVSHVYMDQAGKQRHANKAVIQIWREKTGLPITTNYVYERDNYETINLRLQDDEIDGEPNLLFNATSIKYSRHSRSVAGGVLSETDLWRFPKFKGNQARRTKPIDANNDALKALGYFLFDTFGPVIERRRRRRPKPRKAWFTKETYYQ